MQTRFLLGPAGSGKTFRCLAEIRAALAPWNNKPGTQHRGAFYSTGRAAAPEGPPLILLAPKQATFQLERQLLADPALQGYTRLRIFSFERLAQFVLDALRIAPPPSLNEQGRVMVLRALLMRHGEELKLFRKSARRPGFAQQLSELLGELQQHQFTPAKLRGLAGRQNLPDELRNKLHDLALLLEAYTRWLGEHELQDANLLLDAATEALAGSARCEVPSAKSGKESRVEGRESSVEPSSILHPPSALHFAGLWLDGFAEMTPAEMDLLAAVLPCCERATLAFCLDESAVPASDARASWLSLWANIRKTYQECRRRVEALPDHEVVTESLAREPLKSRFADSPILLRLENDWAGSGFGVRRLAGAFDGASSRAVVGENSPAGKSGDKSPHSKAENALRIVVCANPEAEATFAAREILRFVRSGGRFRDIAVLVRDLERYHKPLERAFRRYEVPFFLDRRESVTHHPLAELTRSALRTVAFGWQHEDWFAALKTGFCPAEETEIDRLENEALARGWRGPKWREPLSITDDPILTGSAERLRQKLVPPFAGLGQRLASLQNQPTGAQLAGALRELWENLKVEKRLQEWADEVRQTPQSALHNPQSAVHLTVWEQMNAWLDNLELAFPRETLPLRSPRGITSENDQGIKPSIPRGEWLPILEAGLANLTVGVIPPALDQVLIGAIDRSRNPDLKLALVLGLNEGVFPAAPAAPILLTDADRDALLERGAALGPDLRDQLARERYLGYIAFTRASQKLVATYSRHDADGKMLNPSPFVSHLQRLLPELKAEEFSGDVGLHEAEHVCELVAPLVTIQIAAERRSPTRRESGDEAQRAGSETGAPIEAWSQLLQLPALEALAESLRQLRNPDPAERLSPTVAEKLYGPALRTSVSRLEEFAACPFRFFVHSGLRAEERKLFELDAREQGSFQHEVLKVFHDQLHAEGERWRDITPEEARERVGRIAAALTTDYRGGLMRDTEQSRFTAQVLTESLQDFVEVLVGWMREQYEFEPAAVELEFGARLNEPTPDPSQEGNALRGPADLLPSREGSGVGSPLLPAWEIDLGAGHKLVLQGRIDRVDLWRSPRGITSAGLSTDSPRGISRAGPNSDSERFIPRGEPDANAALCVVMDYKSSHKQLDPVLMQHGVQLQLLGYLSVLRHWPDPRPLFGVARLIPAGVFYVNLRGKYERASSRAEVLADADAARKLAYRHTGRFDASVVRKLDRRPDALQGDQFNYRLNKDGSVRANSAEALERAKFAELLDNVETQLREMGARIFAGDTVVDPYRKSGTTPCEQCDYRAICRIDPWTHRYRVLRKEEAEANED